MAPQTPLAQVARQLVASPGPALMIYAPPGNVRCPQCHCATAPVKRENPVQDEADIWLCGACSYPFVTARSA